MSGDQRREGAGWRVRPWQEEEGSFKKCGSEEEKIQIPGPHSIYTESESLGMVLVMCMKLVILRHIKVKLGDNVKS